MYHVGFHLDSFFCFCFFLDKQKVRGSIKSNIWYFWEFIACNQSRGKTSLNLYKDT